MLPVNIKTPGSAADALLIQQELRHQVVLEDRFERAKIVAGIDVGYDPARNVSQAALVMMDIDSLTPIHSVIATDETPFPYIPGFLSFREAPVIIKLLSLLTELPDILFIDGQGVAHPRRFGIASHIGVLTGLPSIGVAKSLLCGRYTEPELQKGAISPLIDRGERIGTVLRSRERVAPLFISPGHNISHQTALALVIKCLTRYRLPEPTRLADKLSKMNKSPNLSLF